MNIYFTVAGVIGLVGGFAHAFLGHAWTVRALDENDCVSDKFSGLQNKRLILWFWHFGVVLVSTSVVALLTGVAQTEFNFGLMSFVAFLWCSSAAVFIVVAAQKPSQIFSLPPGLVSVAVAVLLLAVTVPP